MSMFGQPQQSQGLFFPGDAGFEGGSEDGQGDGYGRGPELPATVMGIKQAFREQYALRLHLRRVPHHDFLKLVAARTGLGSIERLLDRDFLESATAAARLMHTRGELARSKDRLDAMEAAVRPFVDPVLPDGTASPQAGFLNVLTQLDALLQTPRRFREDEGGVATMFALAGILPEALSLLKSGEKSLALNDLWVRGGIELLFGKVDDPGLDALRRDVLAAQDALVETILKQMENSTIEENSNIEPALEDQLLNVSNVRRIISDARANKLSRETLTILMRTGTEAAAFPSTRAGADLGDSFGVINAFLDLPNSEKPANLLALLLGYIDDLDFAGSPIEQQRGVAKMREDAKKAKKEIEGMLELGRYGSAFEEALGSVAPDLRVSVPRRVLELVNVLQDPPAGNTPEANAQRFRQWSRMLNAAGGALGLRQLVAAVRLSHGLAAVAESQLQRLEQERQLIDAMLNEYCLEEQRRTAVQFQIAAGNAPQMRAVREDAAPDRAAAALATQLLSSKLTGTEFVSMIDGAIVAAYHVAGSYVKVSTVRDVCMAAKIDPDALMLRDPVLMPIFAQLVAVTYLTTDAAHPDSTSSATTQQRLSAEAKALAQRLAMEIVDRAGRGGHGGGLRPGPDPRFRALLQ